MGKLSAFLYGGVSYAIFLATFLYAVGFVGNVIVPKSIDSGAVGAVTGAILVNVLLLGLFAVQHSVMARTWFKARWTRIVPTPIERSTFVLATCAVMALMFWLWRPIPFTVWNVEGGALGAVLTGLFWVGWAIVLVSTYLINHFDLFGLRQVWLHLKGQEYRPLKFKVPGFYRVVRHPIYVGFIIAFWATPHMTGGHLLFAVATTAYMVLAIRFEEQDLVTALGEDYLQYRRQVSMLFPYPPKKE